MKEPGWEQLSEKKAGIFAWNPKNIPYGEKLAIYPYQNPSLQLTHPILITPFNSLPKPQLSIGSHAGEEAIAQATGLLTKTPPPREIEIKPSGQVVFRVDFNRLIDESRLKKNQDTAYANKFNLVLRKLIKITPRVLAKEHLQKNPILQEDLRLAQASAFFSILATSVLAYPFIEKGNTLHSDTFTALILSLFLIGSTTLRLSKDSKSFNFDYYLRQQAKNKNYFPFFIPEETVKRLILPELSVMSLPDQIIKNNS